MSYLNDLKNRIENGDAFIAKIAELKSSTDYLSPEELKMISTKLESKLAESKILKELLKMLKKKGNVESVLKLKSSLEHLKGVMSGANILSKSEKEVENSAKPDSDGENSADPVENGIKVCSIKFRKCFFEDLNYIQTRNTVH